MASCIELKIKINPEVADIVSGICFDKFQCDGVVQAEEEYKDDLVLVNTTKDALKAYLKSAANVAEILKEQRDLLLQRGFSESDLGSWEFELKEIENQDWSTKWKENWDVTHVSDRITIVPSWINYEAKEGEIIISLDPGSAFGTGTHPTTQLCMRAIEKYMPPYCDMADIGTGSGILAICASKFGAKYAYGCDNDNLVIKIAQENALHNNESEKTFFECKTADQYVHESTVLQSFRGKVIENSFSNSKHPCAKFDFITANILHNVLAIIMGDLKAMLKPEGILVLSGILDEKKQVVIDAIKKMDLELIEEMRQDTWVGIVVKNRR